MTETLVRLRNTIFEKMPTLAQDKVLLLFAEMDRIIRRCMTQLGTMDSTVDFTLNIAAKIAVGKTHGKMIFNRNIKNDGVGVQNKMKHICLSTPCLNSDPAKFYYYNNNSDVETVTFLEKAMRIHSKWAAKKLAPTDILGLGFSRATYEQIVDEFAIATKYYCELCVRFAALRDWVSDQENIEDKYILALQSLHNKMLAVEKSVGCDRTALFSICKNIQSEMVGYIKIRDAIYKPYLRIVFNEAKKHAASDQQTLDNFQNGAMGLMRAVSTSNNPRGVFSSYARQWIVQSIRLKLKSEANAIKLPISNWHIKNAIEEATQKLSSPTLDQSEVDLTSIAAYTGISEAKLSRNVDRFRNTRVITVENETNIDIRQESFHEIAPSNDGNDHPTIEHYMELLNDDESFVIKLTYGMFEQLPGKVPFNMDRINAERLRQNQALRESKRR